MGQRAWLKGVGGAMALSLGLGLLGAASADQPVDRGIGLQPAATDVMEDIIAFHDFILWIIIAISVIVLALLVWVMVRYNRKANPTPKTFTHNATVEVIWTVVPVLILVAIAWQSFPLLYQEERVPRAEMTIKAVGNSWAWTHEYPDHGAFQVFSNMLPAEEARAQGRPALLAVDNPIYVPVDTTVRLLVTSNDVIHSWAMPSFGVKEDAIPGRVNEGWFRVREPGTYYGQCSELCGVNHAFMPIEVRAVSREEFARWVESQGGAMADSGAARPVAPAR